MKANETRIGIDIGGTKIAVATVDIHGRIGARVSFPTDPEAGFEIGVDRMAGAIRKVTQAARLEPAALVGIGIGCAGPVNPARGTIHNPYTLPSWDGCDLVTPLRERFGTAVRLENDADAALLGEWRFGAGRGFDSLVMLTFGTGIGGAALVDGRLLRGAGGEHPEIGHVPVRADGPACYCGTGGCLESLASGTALERAGKEAGFADARAVFAAAARGDATALTLLDRAREATGWATWTLLHTLMPERFILGGGIMDEHFDPFAGTMRAMIARATQVPKGRIEVVRAELGNEAGLVGAASLVMARA